MPNSSFTLRVLTISDRAFAGEYPDTAGPRAAEILAAALPEAKISTIVIPDGKDSVLDAVSDACRAEQRVIVTVGGTGIASRDVTPEASAELIGLPLPGIAEGIRREGEKHTPRAVVSRGLAGVVQADAERGFPSASILINLAGSEDAAAVGSAYIAPLLLHLLQQLDGGSHHA